MLFRTAQADDPHRVVIGALRENHHMEAAVDLPDGDETDLAIIETVVLAFEGGVPIEHCRRLQGNAMLGPIDFVLGRIELDSHLNSCAPI